MIFLKSKHGKAGKGFTLIELLVVIAIIGVLASIVLASLNSARRKSRDTRRIADVNQIRLALELYFDANGGEYPLDIYSATAGLETGCDGDPCMPNVPNDPLNVAYAYTPLDDSSGTTACTADCLYYHLGANLEEDSNSALDNDRDYVAVWHGASDTCAETTAGTTDGCYDVTP